MNDAIFTTYKIAGERKDVGTSFNRNNGLIKSSFDWIANQIHSFNYQDFFCIKERNLSCSSNKKFFNQTIFPRKKTWLC